MEEILFFDFGHKSSILLIFFFNALVFSFLLLKQGVVDDRKDSLWLSLFIFLCGLYICPFMLGYAGWYSLKSYREFLFFVPFQQLFLIGPVIYFYTQSLLHKNFSMSNKQWLHFLPALLYLGYSLVVFVGDQFYFDEFYFYADGRDKDLDFWYQMSGLISMLFYLGLSLNYYRNYRIFTVKEVSFADEISFKWLQYFMIAFGAILLLRVLFFILNPEWGQFGSKYWYYLCYSILFLYIAITGYSSTLRVVASFKAPRGFSLAPSANENVDPTEIEVEDKELTQFWARKISTYFQKDEAYKNSSLTLSDVAEDLKTNRTIISKTINQEFGLNFNDFVNAKRTEAVIKQIQEGGHANKTLLGIALECGFNSKTTFNRAFKKHTALTPKQYVQKLNL